MIDEHIENVIIEMQEKTENDKIKWKRVNKLHNWNRIKSRIEKAKDENLKDFFLMKIILTVLRKKRDLYCC